MFVPPVNFALVVGNVYRSGHPTDLNYGFLESLHLKTIVYLGDGCPEVIAEDYQKWIASQGIEYIHLHSPSVKEPFVGTDRTTVTRTLKIIMDSKNHPILVHSNKGKHRVGVVMAVLRKCLLQWYLTPIYEEYVRFAKGKTGSDLEFIEQYELDDEDIEIRECPKWLIHCQLYGGMANTPEAAEKLTENLKI